MKKHCVFLLLALFVIGGLSACKEEEPMPQGECGSNLQIDWNSYAYAPTPHTLAIPPTLPQTMPIPPDNPLTEEGIALGRKLFYDPILSADSTQSCASCHGIEFAFTDHGKRFSTGIDNIEGNRNSMAIINLGWTNRLFWDGRANGLEDQALQPVTNPVEMHNTWENAVCDLMNSLQYRIDFYRAFGVKEITQTEVTKAIAQFERTLISGASKFDLASTPGTGVFFTEQEDYGFQLFYDEYGGDCFHCHGDPGKFFTDNLFHNNGLDSIAAGGQFADTGLGAITGRPEDNGLFRTTTLRNIALTAPYMHDGRFATLEEVLEHYSEHIKPSPTIDVLMITDFGGTGKHLTQEEKDALIAFMHALTDTAFVNNPAFKNPFD
ncbi:hypothetical protein B6N25_14930 [Sphingobacteriales bacterium TSM_CSS]|nr:hypothetical protein B6N25_14930 [Sphingobacteriales bacterium TSM_CSS]